MNELKNLVNGLNLNKYYNNFIREDYCCNYFIEIYAYKVMNNEDEVIYIGNRTVPSEENYVNSKYVEADYWLNGNDDMYFVLHRYENTCNMTGYVEYNNFNKLGNQALLNDIKQEVVDCLKSNFNVMIMPKDFDMFEQIGLQIHNFKQKIKSTIKWYSIDNFIEDFKFVLKSIKTNALYWHKYLILKNRFWFISISDNDIQERKNINFDDLTISQQVIVIVMKEWLAMIVNESHLNPSYNMHVDKVIYKLENVHYRNVELFNDSKTRIFQHKTAIKLLLSTMYAKSTAKQVEDVYSRFMTWRKNYNINIFKKIQ